MITQLRGELIHMDLSGPLIEVNVSGVGYEVLVPLFLWPDLVAMSGEEGLIDGVPGPSIRLFVHYTSTANQPTPVLVGFLRRAEREFFRKFITVDGIGSAKAVKAMNVSVSTIAQAIEQEDRPALTKLPGIGARGADKIIAALRGKVVAAAALQDGGIAQPVDASRMQEHRIANDAIEAISALGYSRADVKRWVEEVLASKTPPTTVEELTLTVLRSRDTR